MKSSQAVGDYSVLNETILSRVQSIVKVFHPKEKHPKSKKKAKSKNDSNSKKSDVEMSFESFDHIDYGSSKRPALKQVLNGLANPSSEGDLVKMMAALWVRLWAPCSVVFVCMFFPSLSSVSIERLICALVWGEKETTLSPYT